MKNRAGYSLNEILIVLAIAGIMATIGYVSSSNIKVKQQEHAAVAMVKQAIAFAGTSSGAKGQRLRLVYDDSKNALLLKDESNRELEKYKFPSTVNTNLDNGDSLEFTPLGWIDSNSLSGSGGFPNPLIIYTDGNSYSLSITLIGEIKSERSQ